MMFLLVVVCLESGSAGRVALVVVALVAPPHAHERDQTRDDSLHVDHLSVRGPGDGARLQRACGPRARRSIPLSARPIRKMSHTRARTASWSRTPMTPGARAAASSAVTRVLGGAHDARERDVVVADVDPDPVGADDRVGAD